MNNSQIGYFIDTLTMFCDRRVPHNLVSEYIGNTDNILNLQDWISSHRTESTYWMTAISIIEAVELIVESAINNGNI